jgi:hypothetical protein
MRINLVTHFAEKDVLHAGSLKMSKTSFSNVIAAFLLPVFLALFPSYAFSRVTALDIVGLVIKNQITDEFAKTTGKGGDICRVNGRPSYDCGSYISLAQGICLASGRPSYDCNSYMNLNQAICLSTGRPSYDCSSYINLVQAICLARGSASYECNSYMSIDKVFAMPVQDVLWAWDLFDDQYGSPTWACRGKNTGEFSDLDKCSMEEKNDSIWPGQRFQR